MSQNNTIDILHDMKKVCITIYNIDYNNNQTLYWIFEVFNIWNIYQSYKSWILDYAKFTKLYKP